MTEFKPWHIVDIDASQPAQSLAAAPADAQGTLVYFWWRSLPMGHSYISADRLPVSAEDMRLESIDILQPTAARYAQQHVASGRARFELATIADPVSVLDEEVTIDEQRPTVTVVVCTRDRPDQLANCLDSMDTLTTSPSEIIVVDNASSSDATRRVASARSLVRYISEPRAGLDIARNTGFRLATSDIVAFVDDDVSIEPHWLNGVIKAFRNPEVMAMTGLVLAAELQSEAQNIFEKHWPFNRGYLPKEYDAKYYEAARPFGVPAWEIGAGANMAFRREIIDQIGGFDERLDVGAAGCSGDSEYWYRVLSHGMTIRYEPAAVVRHFHRRDEPGLRNQLFHYMRGHTAALLVQYERSRDRGNIKRLYRSLPAYYLRLILREIRRGRSTRGRYIWTEISGGLAGIRYYFRNRKKKTTTSDP